MVSRLLNLLPPHFKTMFFSGVVGVGVGLTVFWRDRLIAQNFGIGQESDIFFLTLAFPVFVASVFTSLSVSGFMPTYLQNRELLVAQKMLTVHLAAAGLIVLVALCFIPFLPPSYQRSCYWLLLLIPITAMASLFVSLLQSHRKYLFVNSLPAIPSLLAVGAIFFFSGHGIIATIYGTIAGYFLMLVV
ncbi:MAG: hypothetical protein KKA05_02425, partial [Alphaproteobacteria bacterium]|nr:hypothetical protein [Alphaproteobacteria bacterium]